MLVWRVGLFFLAAGVWLAGVLVNDNRLTGAAILILFVGILLRFLDRSVADVDADDTDEPN
jgi:hypothetical protein